MNGMAMETEGAWALEFSIKYLYLSLNNKASSCGLGCGWFSCHCHLIHKDGQQESNIPSPLTVVCSSIWSLYSNFFFWQTDLFHLIIFLSICNLSYHMRQVRPIWVSDYFFGNMQSSISHAPIYYKKKSHKDYPKILEFHRYHEVLKSPKTNP